MTEKTEKTTNSYSKVTLTVAVLALICSGLSLASNVGSATFSVASLIDSYQDGNSVNFIDGSIADVAAQVSPAVVSIVTETRVEGYFGTNSAQAAGTGVIVSRDGYVLTNKHVVEDSTSISVVLDSGTTYGENEVELIGVDPSNDIAFLKIKGATDLPYAELGDSKTLNVGQQVIAIGNALGLYQNTVTEGIVSGTGRSVVASDSTGSSAESLTDMIQTDAAINSGNSGGPLVNAAGQVIGINTAVSNANNIGFAIPISSIKGLFKHIVETGKAERAYLGVYYLSLTAQTAKQYELDITSGAYVHSDTTSAVIKGSPADQAGLREGDVITEVNGVKIGAAGSLATLIGEYTIGDEVQLTIYRDGAEFPVSVILATYPSN